MIYICQCKIVIKGCSVQFFITLFFFAFLVFESKSVFCTEQIFIQKNAFNF